MTTLKEMQLRNYLLSPLLKERSITINNKKEIENKAQSLKENRFCFIIISLTSHFSNSTGKPCAFGALDHMGISVLPILF